MPACLLDWLSLQLCYAEHGVVIRNVTWKLIPLLLSRGTPICLLSCLRLKCFKSCLITMWLLNDYLLISKPEQSWDSVLKLTREPTFSPLGFSGNLQGQFWVLQDLVSVGNPEQIPPSFSGTNLILFLVCVPVPQLLEHGENSCQFPHWQFTKIQTNSQLKMQNSKALNRRKQWKIHHGNLNLFLIARISSDPRIL